MKEVARYAALVATGFSLISIIGCMILIPYLYTRVNGINNKLRLEMDEFKVLADDVWKDMMSERSSSPNIKVRKARQANGQCQCNAVNNCSPGSPGPPGEPGFDGPPGESGLSGATGLPGNAPQVTVNPERGCRQCPDGSPGPPGNSGPRGSPGNKGTPGSPGNPGNNGRPGFPGSPGSSGGSGTPGNPGPPGPPGRNADAGGKGLPGVKGPPGRRGSRGQPGQPGTNGRTGNRGSPGSPGSPGPDGPSGQSGNPGRPGLEGPPGEDAQYCPCPTSRTPPPTRPPTTTTTTTTTTRPITTTTQAAIQVKVESCASIVPERFGDYGIVPDSIPEPPPCLVEVVYNTAEGRKDVYLGNRLLELHMASMPIKVLWPASEERLYTLVMYDLDSPSKASATNREVILWMVINVPGSIAKRGTQPGITAGAGETIVAYVGPQPRSGTDRHRIVWLAYAQEITLSSDIWVHLSIDQLVERIGFHIHEGLIIPNRESWQVLTPVAGNFVLVKWEQGQPGVGF